MEAIVRSRQRYHHCMLARPDLPPLRGASRSKRMERILADLPAPQSERMTQKALKRGADPQAVSDIVIRLSTGSLIRAYVSLTHPRSTHTEILRRARLSLEGSHRKLLEPLKFLIFNPTHDPTENSVSRPALSQPGARVASAKRTAAGGALYFHQSDLLSSDLLSFQPRLIEHELAHLAGTGYGPPDWEEWSAARLSDRAWQLARPEPEGATLKPRSIQEELQWGSEWVNAYAAVFTKERARIWEDWAESVALFFTQERYGLISRQGDDFTTFREWFPGRDRLIREWLAT